MGEDVHPEHNLVVSFVAVVVALILAAMAIFVCIKEYNIEKSDVLLKFVQDNSVESLPGSTGKLGLAGFTHSTIQDMTNQAMNMVSRNEAGKEGPINTYSQLEAAANKLSSLADSLGEPDDSRTATIQTEATNASNGLLEIRDLAQSGEDWHYIKESLQSEMESNSEKFNVAPKIVMIALNLVITLAICVIGIYELLKARTALADYQHRGLKPASNTSEESGEAE